MLTQWGSFWIGDHMSMDDTYWQDDRWMKVENIEELSVWSPLFSIGKLDGFLKSHGQVARCWKLLTYSEIASLKMLPNKLYTAHKGIVYLG